jgi:hypothetical protein
LLLAIYATVLQSEREGASNVESQETCRHHPNFIQSFRVKGDV